MTSFFVSPLRDVWQRDFDDSRVETEDSLFTILPPTRLGNVTRYWKSAAVKDRVFTQPGAHHILVTQDWHLVSHRLPNSPAVQ